jgi:PIN domain nuclease of toxin-antitoxin system
VKLLLDTNILVYWLIGTLPHKIKRRIEKASDLLVSIVTSWEFALKSNSPSGKIRFPTTEETERILEDLGARILPITMEHTNMVYTLPLHHEDPFDRMIIAQALAEKCPVVSADQRFPLYQSAGLQVLWD